MSGLALYSVESDYFVDVPMELMCPRTGEACEMAIEVTERIINLAQDAKTLGAFEKIVDRCVDIHECPLEKRADTSEVEAFAGGNS